MLVIHNAKIRTLNPIQPFATALAMDHGEVLAVGMDDDILSRFAGQDLFDASGHAIIPGLTDAHIHLEDYALSLQKVDCETRTREECLQRVAERARITPPGEWVLGHGWNQHNWVEGYGSVAMLDEIAPQNPVYLTHKSLHSGWANSYALRLAGITINTPDPAGGRINRLQSGEPDGILLESASELLEHFIPEPTLEKVVSALRTSLPLLWRVGLTGIHDFSRSRCFSALQVLHDNHELRFRVVKGIPLENLAQAVELGLRTGFGDDFLRIGPVKMFSDGALGPHTAAMLQPYEDDPGNRGILMIDAEELFEQGRIAVSNGISMAVHAIGDRANHEVLNGYAELREFEHSLPPLSRDQLRHRIEHVQVIHPDDAARFSRLGIIASMQPIHATSDMLMADQYWGTRSALAYAWRSQLSNGARLAFGSDAPVESPNPFWGIHAAVTRRHQDGSPSPKGWYPEQCLSVDEALHAYTTGAAYAAGMEDQLGILAAGYLADLLVLNEDPFTCPPDELMNIKPIATMVAGEWVYSAGI
jgi:predicted amidohydrolase YtcJ